MIQSREPHLQYDTVIYGGAIITMNSASDVMTDGIICISGTKIDHIGPHTGTIPAADQTVDAQDCLILPGLVNTHTHLPMSLFRGIADDLPLKKWLYDHIFPAEAACIDPESVRYGTLLSCAEMILSGTTTCCDGYFLEDEVAEAVHQTGIRAVLGQGVIDFPAPGVPNPTQNITHAVSFLEKWISRSPLITPSIFCHSPYTCSSQTLQNAKEAARSRNLLFQIHAAETKEERTRMASEHGVSPIAYLDQLGVLDDRTLLIHAIWIDDRDIEIIQKRRCTVSVVTESGMKLGSGIAPLPQILAAGIPVGLGTDGCASNNDLDMFREMDMTAKLHKVNTSDPTVMNSETVLNLASFKGAQAVGLQDSIGSLESGKQADLIIIDAKKPHLTPLYNPKSHLVYAASGADVRDVMIAGNMILRNRCFQTIQIEDIFDWFHRYHPLLEKLDHQIG